MRGVCEEITVKAPAKVNLHLNVGEKLSSGFHEISSIFQRIDIYDELCVSILSEKGVYIETEGEKIEGENIIERAYRAFVEEKKIENGFKVRLKKRIPVMSGLGGGSSDAASFVKAMEKLTGITLSEGEKYRISEKCGKDVHFFLKNKSGAAFVTGGGEKVKDIQKRDDLYFLLLIINSKNGTKGAYSAIDDFRFAKKAKENKDNAGGKENPREKLNTKKDRRSELIKMYYKNIGEWGFQNDFEVALKNNEEVMSALSFLRKERIFASISGSGTSVYAVLDGMKEAKFIGEKLKDAEYKCVIAR